MSMSKNEFSGFFSHGKRLKEERIRNNLKQKEIAKEAGIAIRTLSKYERGETLPDVLTLEKLHKIGFDIAYIVTGHKLSLSSEEENIIKQYRKADKTVKFVVRSIFNAFKL